MFSRYKKSSASNAKPALAPVTTPAERPKAAPAGDAPAASLRRAAQKPAAVVQPADKERKRKERMSEIKLDLHRALLDNLNLGALETATEADLRAEISSIAGEFLEERSIVLNREDRNTLTQELYDEVRGLGPLETLLQDDTVNDILVNGPHQIFVERDGKLQLSDVTFKDEKPPSRMKSPCCASSTRSCRQWAGGSMNPTPMWTPVLPTGRVSTRWCRRSRWMAAWCRSGNSRRTSLASTTL